MTVASQVLGPFLLTSLLLPLLEAGESRGRVIAVASGGMYPEKLDVDKLLARPDSYNGVRAYARAKRAQVELNVEWARRCGSKAIFQAMHPGWVDTPGVVKSLPRFHSITKPVLRSAEAVASGSIGTGGVSPRSQGREHRRATATASGSGVKTTVGQVDNPREDCECRLRYLRAYMCTPA
jgi:NAD(P)-dependent dehydrogenase (short-subunit alcohol dehydrogenase family)